MRGDRRARPAIDRRTFLASAGLAGLGLAAGAACRSGGAGAPAGGAVRLPISADPRSLDPVRAPDLDGWRLARLIGDSLVDVDAAARPVARLARRWAWDDDGTALTFELRPGARWHDGRPVTAEDVAFTWRTAVDPAVSLPETRQGFAGIERIETPSAGTVVVRYREPFAPALLSWRLPVIPRHHADRAERPLGCGPWRFASWRTGERIELEANRDYHAGAPGVSGLRFEIIRGYTGQLDALIADHVDVAPLAPDGYRRVRDDEAFARRFAIASYRMPYIFYIAWRIDRSPPLFDDARVRRALSLAIDRAGYLERVADGLGDVGVTSFHPEIWGYDESIAPWPFDPSRAAALLDAAGWIRGGDGVRRRGDVPFRFSLAYAATSVENDRIASFVQANLREVGIVMDLEPLDWSVLLDRMQQRRFDAVMSGRMLDFDPDPYELWHSSQIDGGVNYAGYRDDEVDALIERARRIHDREARARIYARIQRRLHEDEPMTVLFYPRSRVAVRRGLAGFRAGPAGYYDYWPGAFAWRWEEQASAGRSRGRWSA